MFKSFSYRPCNSLIKSICWEKSLEGILKQETLRYLPLTGAGAKYVDDIPSQQSQEVEQMLS